MFYFTYDGHSNADVSTSVGCLAYWDFVIIIREAVPEWISPLASLLALADLRAGA